jgi:hypothetical protein
MMDLTTVAEVILAIAETTILIFVILYAQNCENV